MFHKQDVKRKLVKQVEKKQFSKTEANRRYITEMESRVEHIYRGDLPFPSMAGQVKRNVLAIVGQVMYLYTVKW